MATEKWHHPCLEWLSVGFSFTMLILLPPSWIFPRKIVVWSRVESKIIKCGGVILLSYFPQVTEKQIEIVCPATEKMLLLRRQGKVIQEQTDKCSLMESVLVLFGIFVSFCSWTWRPYLHSVYTISDKSCQLIQPGVFSMYFTAVRFEFLGSIKTFVFLQLLWYWFVANC